MQAVDIFDLVTPGNIVAYWDKSKANQTAYMGELLFPPKQQLGMKINKIGGRAGLPVELKASGFDTQATYRDRLSVEASSQTMAFFRERMKIDEETRQEMLKLRTAGNNTVLDPLLNNIFDDTNNLIMGARVARERMAMQLISSGKISIVSNGVNMEYDYGLDTSTQTAQAKVDWSDPNADILKEIQDWKDAYNTEHGINLSYAIMTTKTFGYFVSNKGIIKTLYPNSADITGIHVRRDAIKQLVLDAVGVQILLYDQVYATQVGGGAKKFFPDNVITFLPDGFTLGNMIFGTTPEQMDLMGNVLTNATVSITDTGVAVTNMMIPHPVNIETMVSQVCLPSFGSDVENGAGAIFIATVVK